MSLSDLLRRPWEKWMTALTEVRIQNSLRSEHCHLFGVSKGIPFVADVLPSSTDVIVPVLNIHAAQFNRYVTSANAGITFVVDSGGVRHALGSLTFVLMAQPLHLHQIGFKWRGTKCEQIRGAATLRAFVADRELVALPFQVVNWEDMARAIGVDGLSVNVALKDGRHVERPGQLGIDQAVTMAPSFSVRCPAFAPNWDFQGRFVVHQGARVLAGAPITLVPNAGIVRFDMGKVTFPTDLLISESIKVRVEIATLVKALHEIQVLEAPPVTNYEGALAATNQKRRRQTADLPALLRSIEDI